MLRQTLHVCVGSKIQKIQSSDWLKLGMTLRNFTTFATTKRHLRWSDNGCQYVNCLMLPKIITANIHSSLFQIIDSLRESSGFIIIFRQLFCFH